MLNYNMRPPTHAVAAGRGGGEGGHPPRAALYVQGAAFGGAKI